MADRLTPEDRVAIMDLIADIPFRLDIRDLDGYVNNFTPDGVLEGESGRHVGREAIRAYMAGIFERSGSGPRTLRHILGIPLIRGDGGGCLVQTQLMIPQVVDDGRLAVLRAGVYFDEVVLHEGRWRFRHRRVRMDLQDVALR